MHKRKIVLKSILEAIEKIEEYTKNFKDADSFYHDQKSFDATMMQFVVIGEMVVKLDEEFESLHNDIPWKDIKDFRNIIAHNYFGIDADEIWDIISSELNELKQNIKKLI